MHLTWKARSRATIISAMKIYPRDKIRCEVSCRNVFGGQICLPLLEGLQPCFLFTDLHQQRLSEAMCLQGETSDLDDAVAFQTPEKLLAV